MAHWSLQLKEMLCIYILIKVYLTIPLNASTFAFSDNTEKALQHCPTHTL